MRIVADLHLHSKYSRAVSKQMDLEHLALWGKKKGIDLIATGDYTHPLWFSELKRKLEEDKPGIFKLKGSTEKTRFILSTEISKIYAQGGKVRRIHNVVLAPSIEAVEKLNKKLALVGNLYADGRPTFGMNSRDFLKLIKDTDPDFCLIPAHAWTPWFSVFGSKSGFDSIEECFGDQTEHIFAIETGLSSDPPMNWRLSKLDRYTIVSFSDAHSPHNLMREATVFDLDKLSFPTLIQAIAKPDEKHKILYTVEFYPEEGMYHYDGLRDEGLRWTPAETKKNNFRSPRTGKPVTVGVLHRVEELADRPEGYQAGNRPPFKRLVQLEQIIAEAMGVGETAVKVQTEYERIVRELGTEFSVLVETSLEEVKKVAGDRVADGLNRVREENITIEPGYDGQYGTVRVFGGKEDSKSQESLF